VRRLRQEVGALRAGPARAPAGTGVSALPGRGLPGPELAAAEGQPVGAAADPGARLPGLSLRGQRGVAGGRLPLNFVRYADIDLAYPQQGEVRGEAFIFQDRELVPDHRYFYRVAAYDQDGYLGSWSPTLSRVWGWLPRPPLDLQAVLGDRVVALRWSPVSQLTNGSPARDLTGYLIYRREGSGAWSQISPEPVSQTAFQDVAVKNEVEYTYKVLAVRRLGGELLASADSPLVSARPEKLTPPPPLSGLLAVPTSQGVELRWQTSPAPDVAGYRLYRRSPGEARAGLLAPELLTKPYFVDSGVQRGQTYYYYVTAVDNSPRANESLPSEEAEITY